MLFPVLPSSYFYLLLGFGRAKLSSNSNYKAIINPSNIKSTINNIINLDSRGSYTSLGAEPLFYYWNFKSIPIGSNIQKIGFKNNKDRVSFVPDKTGIYEVELIVGDNIANSEPTIARIEVSLLLTSEGQGYLPDTSYIWKLLGNSWDRFD